jgi:mRNA interferase HigB
MNVIAKRTLREFYGAHAKAKGPMESWHKECTRANWSKFADVKEVYHSADLVGNKIVFNIGGNNYRIVCKVDFSGQVMFIKWVGTHAEYDRLDVSKL